MRCLVTGGAGFIGSNLAIELEKQGNEVTIIDNFFTGHKDNIATFKGKVITQDISLKIDIQGNFDAIFHQAAITDPRYTDDDNLLRQNLVGFENIIALAKKSKAKLIYASSASIYGNGASPQKEEQPKDLQSAYAKSKIIMDEMASHHFGQMHIVGLRYFNVFGLHESHKGRPASMIFHLINQIRAGKQPRLFKWGEQKRDHIYVKDCVRANILALDGKPGIYNVGTGIATTFSELLDYINDALGTEQEPEFIDMPYDPKTYQINTQADTRKAEAGLNFKAKYILIDAIKEYSGLI
jgi:ADP-L-glycero-D-manno-heptose 6-epimerase